MFRYVWSNFIRQNGYKGWCVDLPYGIKMWDALVWRGWWKACAQRFLRLSAYQKSRGLDPSIPAASDLQLAIILAETGCGFVHQPKITYWYRDGRKGSIGSDRRFQQRCADELIRRARTWDKEHKGGHKRKRKN